VLRLLQEVLDGGEHAAAGLVLVGRVAEVRVESALLGESHKTGAQALLLVGLAMFRRYGRRIVVEVAPPVGPADVVQHHEGERNREVFAPLLDGLQFVEDRVPVVVAIYQDKIKPVDPRQSVEAEVFVEDEAFAVVLPPLVHVVFRQRVYDVQRRAAPAAELQQVLRVAPGIGANLDDRLGTQDLYDRLDHGFPETLHYFYPVYALDERPMRPGRGYAVLVGLILSRASRCPALWGRPLVWRPPCPLGPPLEARPCGCPSLLWTSCRLSATFSKALLPT